MRYSLRSESVMFRQIDIAVKLSAWICNLFNKMNHDKKKITEEKCKPSMVIRSS